MRHGEALRQMREPSEGSIHAACFKCPTFAQNSTYLIASSRPIGRAVARAFEQRTAFSVLSGTAAPPMPSALKNEMRLCAESCCSTLGRALAAYAGAWEKIADARVAQDAAVRDRFLLPWQTTLSTAIAVAMKARQAVRVSRLELDAAKQT